MKEEELAAVALRYVDEITAYAHRLTRSRADADDLVQATYERAFRHARQVREPAGVRAWLFRITRNLHYDQLRSRAARPELRVVQPQDRPAGEPTVSPQTVERARADDIATALETLPADQQEAVLLCDLWGFQYAEIAEIMDVPVGTVRSRIARGRDALAHRLSSASDDGSQRGGSP